MSKLTDRVSYLKGLADGLNLDMEQGSNKLLMEILNLLGDVTEEIDELDNDLEELDENVESIDDDLADLEEVLFGDDEDDECHCGCHHDHDDEDDEDEEDEDDEIILYACPTCGHEIQFNASSVDFDEVYLCPECGKPVFPELEEDEDDEE